MLVWRAILSFLVLLLALQARATSAPENYEDEIPMQVVDAIEALKSMPELTAEKFVPVKKSPFAQLKSSPTAGPKSTSIGFAKIDEPGGVVTLPVNNALACPGFYILTIGDGPDSGFLRGSYGAELLLREPGSRLLNGGLNFGGMLDGSAPGYAAFTIANDANENQRVDINLTGYRALSGNPNIRVRVVLERRQPNPTLIVSESVTVGVNAAYQRSVVVSPGFYVASVEPIDQLAGGGDGFFSMSVLSGFTNRPGGGFQGGVVFGGYHDPSLGNTSGFAGFCIADAHAVQVRTEGRPTRGPSGAGDMRIVVSNNSGQIFFANPTSVSPPVVDDHGNSCATASGVTSNGVFSGTINPASDADFFRFTVAASGTVTLQSTSSATLDPFGTLLDSNCNVITQDDDGAGSLNFRIQRSLNAGTYFLAVQSFGQSSTGAYSVSVSSPTGGGGDAGDSCQTAQAISYPSTVAGSISPASDLDFFRFTVPSTQTVTISASSNFDSFGQLRDQNCLLIAEDDDSNGNLNFRIVRTLSAGSYFLRVSSFAGGSSGNYTVSLSGVASGTNATIRVVNRLVESVRVLANGALLGTVTNGSTANLAYSGSSSVQISWELIRRTTSQGSPVGDTMGGLFAQTTVGSGQILEYTIDNVVASTPYFTPWVSNQTSSTLLMGVNMGLASENRCNCTVAGNLQNVVLGYYRAFSNSNVRAYRSNSNYTGPYIYWGTDSSGVTTPIPNLMESGSGVVRLNANTAP